MTHEDGYVHVDVVHYGFLLDVIEVAGHIQSANMMSFGHGTVHAVIFTVIFFMMELCKLGRP